MPAGVRSRRSTRYSQRRIVNIGQVSGGNFAAASCPGGQPWEQGSPQNPRVQLVQAAIVSHQFMMVFGGLAVVAQGTYDAHQFGVGTDDGSGIAQGAKILGRIEAGGSQAPGGSRGQSGMASSNRLCTVLYHAAVKIADDPIEKAAVERVSVKMNRNQIADIGPRLQELAAAVQIEESEFVGIGENRHSSELQDGQSSRKSRNRSGEDLIAGPAAKSTKRYLNGIQAAGHSNSLRKLPVSGQR